MSKLAQRLMDAARSGVYWTAQSVEVEEAVRGTGLELAHADLSGADGKDAPLARLAVALGLPARFVSDWNLLEANAGDLGWRTGDGHVILFSGHEELAADDLGTLIGVLAAGAAFWGERGRSFFAVFVDATNVLALPQLFRPKST